MSTPPPGGYAPVVTSFGLTFHDLEVHYGRTRLLHGLSGEVWRGETLLVAGHNGSGKSTLLRCLAGLQRPRRGAIEFRNGSGPAEEGWRRQDLGWLGPDLAFYPELSVAENLSLFRRLRRLEPADDEDRELVDRLGLPPDRPAGALSSGMMQRLRWIWALQGHPRVLLLDEPFQNLDVRGIETLSALLAERLPNACVIVATPSPLVLPDAPKRVVELVG